VAGTVYSVQFISTDNVALNPTYEVPAGYRAILRDLDAWCGGTPTSQGIVMENLSTGALIWYEPFTTEFQISQWRGRQVIDEGQQVQLTTGAGAPIHASLSGYLLTLP
jgi:hypothetical protein